MNTNDTRAMLLIDLGLHRGILPGPLGLPEVSTAAPMIYGYLDLQKSPKERTLYCLYSLFWDIGPLFWALLEVQVLGSLRALRQLVADHGAESAEGNASSLQQTLLFSALV